MKNCVFGILFFALCGIAADKNVVESKKSCDIEFMVNGKLIYCKAIENMELSFCSHKEYEGFILWKENFVAPFLPILFTKGQLILDLSMTSIKINHEAIARRDDLKFSWYELLSVDTLPLLDEVCTAFCTSKGNADIFIRLMNYIGTLRNALDALRKGSAVLPRKQELSIKEDVLKSRLVVENVTQEKVTQKISAHAMECLNDESRRFSDSLRLTMDGKIPFPEEADRVCREILIMKEIVLGRKDDGCHLQAHLMCHQWKRLGYACGKIWIKADLRDPNGKAFWGYHVAAIIFVRNLGEPDIGIIDPALNKEKLLTQDEWMNLLKLDNIEKTKLVEYPLPENGSFFEPILICFSSHVPLFPYGAYAGDSVEATFEYAQQEAKKYSITTENF